MATSRVDPNLRASLPSTPPSRVFREVNDRIRALAVSSDADTRREFICECDDPDCVEIVPMSLADYDRLRRTAGRRLLARPHRARAATSDRAQEPEHELRK